MRKSLELTFSEVIDLLIKKFNMKVRFKNGNHLISSVMPKTIRHRKTYWKICIREI